MRHKTEPQAFGEGRHLRHGLHLLAAAAQHYYVRVVDHHALRRAAEVAQRCGEKGLAIEALKRRPDLEIKQARVTQDRRGCLGFELASGHRHFMRRGVVLQLDAGFEVIAADRHDGLLPDALSAAERRQRLIRQTGSAGEQFLMDSHEVPLAGM